MSPMLPHVFTVLQMFMTVVENSTHDRCYMTAHDLINMLLVPMC